MARRRTLLAVANLTGNETNRSSTLGEAIKLRRQELGLRAEDVASRGRVSIRTLYRIEAGEDVTFKTLERIADALELSLPELVAKRAS